MLQFAIPCLLGLESLVGDEVKKLGLADIRVENGRVLCRGEERDLARLNINLRCGARVLLVLASFRATDFETLFQGTRAVRWEDWIPREGEFPVVGYSINSTLHSVPACQSIVKKAVVDRLSAAYGIAQFLETGRRYQVRFSIMKDWDMPRSFSSMASAAKISSHFMIFLLIRYSTVRQNSTRRRTSAVSFFSKRSVSPPISSSTAPSSKPASVPANSLRPSRFL